MEKTKVIIFGTAQLSELALYYLENDPKYNNIEIVGFTVHDKYKSIEVYHNKPVYSFETLKETFSPKEYKLFAPMTGKKLNKIREKVYYEGKQMGYDFISYISSYATVLTENIGENCFILEDNTIQPYTKIGHNVVLWSGNHIGHHSVIKDHVFVTSHCVISGNCILESYSWLGVNCTIRNAITISEGVVVAMSASIVKNTEPYKLYLGIPAKEKCDSNKISDTL